MRLIQKKTGWALMAIGLIIWFVFGFLYRPFVRPQPIRLESGEIQRSESGKAMYDSKSVATFQQVTRPFDIAGTIGVIVALCGVLTWWHEGCKEGKAEP